jgi:hypothetical protein
MLAPTIEPLLALSGSYYFGCQHQLASDFGFKIKLMGVVCTLATALVSGLAPRTGLSSCTA